MPSLLFTPFRWLRHYASPFISFLPFSELSFSFRHYDIYYYAAIIDAITLPLRHFFHAMLIESLRLLMPLHFHDDTPLLSHCCRLLFAAAITPHAAIIIDAAMITLFIITIYADYATPLIIFWYIDFFAFIYFRLSRFSFLIIIISPLPLLLLMPLFMLLLLIRWLRRHDDIFIFAIIDSLFISLFIFCLIFFDFRYAIIIIIIADADAAIIDDISHCHDYCHYYAMPPLSMLIIIFVFIIIAGRADYFAAWWGCYISDVLMPILWYAAAADDCQLRRAFHATPLLHAISVYVGWLMSARRLLHAIY